MPTTPNFPSIPVPKGNFNSMLETILTLKRTVEMLTGQDPASPNGNQREFFAPHVFVQQGTPEALHVGDLWLAQQKSWSFNIWTGNEWLKIADIAMPSGLTHVYSRTPGFVRRRA